MIVVVARDNHLITTEKKGKINPPQKKTNCVL